MATISSNAQKDVKKAAEKYLHPLAYRGLPIDAIATGGQ
tara:strand:+ start:101 stop:217 length:117 start_codon:yes stop_codon:yes gene_type:complete